MLSFPAEFPFKRRAGDATEAAPAAAAPLPDTDLPSPVEETATPAVVIPVAVHAALAPVVERRAAVMTAPAAPIALARERRKARRDSMATTALIRADGIHGPPIKVALSDISIAGARFRSARPMDPDEKGQIRLEVGPVRWTTRLRVVYCAQDDDGLNTIGCAFLRTELLRPWPLTAA